MVSVAVSALANVSVIAGAARQKVLVYIQAPCPRGQLVPIAGTHQNQKSDSRSNNSKKESKQARSTKPTTKQQLFHHPAHHHHQKEQQQQYHIIHTNINDYSKTTRNKKKNHSNHDKNQSKSSTDNIISISITLQTVKARHAKAEVVGVQRFPAGSLIAFSVCVVGRMVKQLLFGRWLR